MVDQEDHDRAVAHAIPGAGPGVCWWLHEVHCPGTGTSSMRSCTVFCQGSAGWTVEKKESRLLLDVSLLHSLTWVARSDWWATHCRRPVNEWEYFVSRSWLAQSPPQGGVFFIPLCVQCRSSSWTILVFTGTRSCAEQPSLPKILQFCQLPRSNPILAPVVSRKGWFVIISQEDRYSCRRINDRVHFPKFGFAGVVWPSDYRSIANARARVLLCLLNFWLIFDHNQPVMALRAYVNGIKLIPVLTSNTTVASLLFPGCRLFRIGLHRFPIDMYLWTDGCI